MLGGDDDDIQALLEGCGSQIERPGIRAVEDQAGNFPTREVAQPQAQGLGMLVESINSF